MKLSDFYAAIEKYAPIGYSKEFCEKYGAYDNSGILIDCGGEVSKAVFALDLSEEAVTFAVSVGADTIVTHHPAIYGKLAALKKGSAESGAVFAAIRQGVSVIGAHLNLDAAQGGIDESLAQGVRVAAVAANGEKRPTQGENDRADGEKKMYTFSCGAGGYGRVYDVTECTAGKLKEAFDETFGGKHTLLFADAGKKIGRVASFCGAGADEESAAFAEENGADLLISSDIKHHILKRLTDRGIAVLAPTHYACESYGFYQFYQKIVKATGIVCEYFSDDELL